MYAINARLLRDTELTEKIPRDLRSVLAHIGRRIILYKKFGLIVLNFQDE